MKKTIITCLAASAILSFAGCHSKPTSTSTTTTTSEQTTVPAPTTTTTTQTETIKK